MLNMLQSENWEISKVTIENKYITREDGTTVIAPRCTMVIDGKVRGAGFPIKIIQPTNEGASDE